MAILERGGTKRMNEETCDFEKIIEYINSLTFKRKVIGGIDKEEVYTCMQKLNSMYRECISDIKKAHGEETDRLRELLDKARKKEQEYSEKIDLLTTAAIDVKNNKEAVLQQAEIAAQQMKEQTLEEVEHIVEEKTEKINRQCQEAQALFNELNIVKENSVNNLNSIVSDLNNVFVQISNLQEKLRDMPDMSNTIASPVPIDLEEGEEHEPDSEE